MTLPTYYVSVLTALVTVFDWLTVISVVLYLVVFSEVLGNPRINLSTARNRAL